MRKIIAQRLVEASVGSAFLSPSTSTPDRSWKRARLVRREGADAAKITVNDFVFKSSVRQR
jgi:hypothetical protein